MSDAAWALRTAREVGPIHPPHAHPPHKPHKLHTGPLHSTVAGRTDHLPSQVPNGSFVLPADIVSGLGEGNTMSGFKAAKRMFEGAHREFGGTPYAGSNGPYGQGTGLPYAIGHASGGVIGRNEKQTLIGPGTEEWQRGPGVGMPDSENAVTGPTMPGGDNQSFQEQLENNRNRQDIIDQHIGTEMAKGGQVDQAVPVAVAGGEHVLAPHEVAFAGMGDVEAGHKALEAFVLRQRAKLIKTLKGLPGPKRD